MVENTAIGSIRTYLTGLYQQSERQRNYVHVLQFETRIMQDSLILKPRELSAQNKDALKLLDIAQGTSLLYRVIQSSQLPAGINYHIDTSPILSFCDDTTVKHLLVQDRVPSIIYGDLIMLRQLAEAVSDGHQDFASLIGFKGAQMNGESFIRDYAKWWVGCYGKIGFQKCNRDDFAELLHPAAVEILRNNRCL